MPTRPVNLSNMLVMYNNGPVRAAALEKDLNEQDHYKGSSLFSRRP